MALENLTADLHHFALSDPPECLPFRPTEDKAWLVPKLEDIPRYLFRVFTPKSSGATDELWTKSKDARNTRSDSVVDIFDRNDRSVVRMLNVHLRWWQDDDNLVSWTSSLLFALVYVFYLHANTKDRSDFGKIYLCIVDTTDFEKGVFLRDMDLIRAYPKLNTKLEEFKNLRRDQGPTSKYFGKYLSQGALKIESRSKIISASAIIEQGLFDLRPEFKTFAEWEVLDRPRWAIPVIHLRQELFQKTVERIPEKALKAAIGIASLFGPPWQLPVAANLMALCPGEIEKDIHMQALGTDLFSGMLLSVWLEM